MTRKFLITSGFTLFVVYLCYTIFTGCNAVTDKTINEAAFVLEEAHYVGGEKCVSCHAQEHADWKTSDHYLAMQPANDASVVGDFNDKEYTADGVTNRFFRRNGKYFINTQDGDGKYQDFEVLYTFGFFPLQQYLVATEGGRMQSMRVSWDARSKKWFHQYPGQKIFHKDWLHWTGNSQNWNTMCASCHSTNLKKNYNEEADAYTTTWKDINVSCESCHGPGSNHIDRVSAPDYKSGQGGGMNSGLVYAKDTSNQQQLNTCAPCHARKTDISQTMIHSGELLDDLLPQVISTEHYYADGQIKNEDYEYGSFAQSKMFHNNVRCSNCHNPHSGKLKLKGNAMCLSCHQPEYDKPEHHFHAAGTEGAQCVNCHMPQKTYMGNDHRRDHSFRIPRPDQSITFGTPNTCISCHTKKSNQWAAAAIVKWYGKDRAYHFSDDLAPGSLLNGESEKHLLKLLADTSQPEIARATAAYYLGSMNTQGGSVALLHVLNDKKPLVRYHAVRALQNFNPEVWKGNAFTILTDKVRAVRIAAADLYHTIPPSEIPANYKSAFERADAENRRYLHEQTDFSVGNVMVADFKLQEGNYLEAVKYYIRGLKKDSLMNYARLNLSAAYSSMGKNPEALQALENAARIDQGNDRIFYNLGLLNYEMNNAPEAIKNFQRGVQLNSQNTDLYYNYGLLLQIQKKPSEAEKIFLRGYKIEPGNIKINNALAIFYLQQDQPQKAKIHATVLYQQDPNNPEYKEIFSSLGF